MKLGLILSSLILLAGVGDVSAFKAKEILKAVHSNDFKTLIKEGVKCFFLSRELVKGTSVPRVSFTEEVLEHVEEDRVLGTHILIDPEGDALLARPFGGMEIEDVSFCESMGYLIIVDKEGHAFGHKIKSDGTPQEASIPLPVAGRSNGIAAVFIEEEEAFHLVKEGGRIDSEALWGGAEIKLDLLKTTN